MPTKRCCCGVLCEGITGLFGTGVETHTPTPCAQAFGIDSHWTANGGNAYAYFNGIGTPEEDPTNLLGCPGVPALTPVCATDILDKAIVEPGGPDGAETIFRLDFEIASGVDLDAIAFCGTFAADNYVKAGCWKVNGVDQAHIEHGAYTLPVAGPGVDGGIPCRDFAFTNDTAPLVHGTNVIEITVKNGWIGSADDYGGPHFFQMTIDCVDRYPCEGVCKEWTAIEGDTEELDWSETTSGDCPCYCEECPDFPPNPPTFLGETYSASCQEIIVE